MMERPALVPILPRAAAAQILGLSVATIKRHERADPDFPEPHAIGPTRIGYRADDLGRYQQKLAERARQRPMPPADPRVAGFAAAAVRAAKISKTAAQAAPGVADRRNGAGDDRHIGASFGGVKRTSRRG